VKGHRKKTFHSEEEGEGDENTLDPSTVWIKQSVKPKGVPKVKYLKGRAIAQAVNRWLPTAATRDQTRV
jgi:hypothetical protein